jgi:hypothetical protein
MKARARVRRAFSTNPRCAEGANQRQRGPWVNITVADRRMVGRDAEGDDLARRGRRISLRAKLSESFSVLKHVVGREHGDDRLRIVSRRPRQPRRQRRRRCHADAHQTGSPPPRHLPKAIIEIGDDDPGTEHSGIGDDADDLLKG